MQNVWPRLIISHCIGGVVGRGVILHIVSRKGHVFSPRSGYGFVRI